jgi:hypothetical protein
MHMCRYSDKNADGYQKVVGEIRSLSQERKELPFPGLISGPINDEYSIHARGDSGINYSYPLRPSAAELDGPRAPLPPPRENATFIPAIATGKTSHHRTRTNTDNEARPRNPR